MVQLVVVYSHCGCGHFGGGHKGGGRCGGGGRCYGVGRRCVGVVVVFAMVGIVEAVFTVWVVVLVVVIVMHIAQCPYIVQYCVKNVSIRLI